MQPVFRHIAIALVLLAVAVGATSSATASGHRHQAAETRLAGPWYTPQELKALITYSNASFHQKRKLLAGASR